MDATNPPQVQCPRCFGRGYIPRKQRKTRENPNGLGFRAEDCARCRGAGYVHSKAKALPTPTAQGSKCEGDAYGDGYPGTRYFHKSPGCPGHD